MRSQNFSFGSVCVCSLLLITQLIAETVLDLGKYFKRAFKKGISIQIFDDAKKSKVKKKKVDPAPAPPDKSLEKEWEFEKSATETPVNPVNAVPSDTKGASAAAKPAVVTEASDTNSTLASAAPDTSAPADSKITEIEAEPEDALFDAPVQSKEIELTETSTTSGNELSNSGSKPPDPTEKKHNLPPSPPPPSSPQSSSFNCFKKQKQDAGSDDEEAPLMDAKQRERDEDEKEATATVSMIKGFLLSQILSSFIGDD